MAAPRGSEVWRDFVADGIPSSGANNPKKSDIRSWAGWLENLVTSGVLSSGPWFATKAAMTLAYAANTIAIVYNDPTAANNGLYIKTGASGSGAWTQLTSFLPGYQFVTASATGASTANAIVASTSPRLPAGDGVALVTLAIPATNTNSPVTVSFDGGATLTIKTRTGEDPDAGELQQNDVVAGFVSGATFRLISDLNSLRNAQSAKAWANNEEGTPVPTTLGGDGVTTFSAKHWAAKSGEDADRSEEEADRSEVARAGSESARDQAAGYVNDIVSEKEVPITATRNGMESLQFPAGMNSLVTRGYAAMGDGGGAQYVRVASEPASGLKVRSVDRFLPNGSIDVENGGWWEITKSPSDVLSSGASRGLPTPTFIAGSVALKPNSDVGVEATDSSVSLQRAVDYAADFGKFLEAPEGVYGIDGYKGSQPVWTIGNSVHGGLVIQPGTRLIGAGYGKTIFRNIADNWRCVFSLIPGRISIRGVTIDGDIANHPNIPLGTTGPDAGSVRGEGIITAFSGDIELLIEDVEVVNTAHYGIGLQVGKIRSGLLRNLHFRNIGGDCIDIKTHTTPDTSKQLILEQLFAYDGCGHNYIGGPGVSPHENQACFDIGGPSIVRGVRIYNLDSYGTQLGNVGIRTRAAIDAEYRTQARFADISDFYIKSSKLAGEGSGTSKRIIGVVVNSENTHISNGTIEDCFDGLRSFSATSDNTANNGVIRDITAINCRGSEAGAGFRLTSGSRGTKGGGLVAENCDIGLSVTTTKVALHGVHLKNNSLGLDASDEALRDSNMTGVTFEGNVADKNSVTVPVSREYMPSPVSVVAERSALINLVSTYNGSGWAGISFGGIRVHKADNTGVPVGEIARLDYRSSGDSGGNGFWVASVKTVEGNWRDLLTLSTDVAALDVGLQLKSRTVSELATETVTAGKVFYCPNGNSGSPCLAVGVGGSWLRVPLGAIVSAS